MNPWISLAVIAAMAVVLDLAACWGDRKRPRQANSIARSAESRRMPGLADAIPDRARRHAAVARMVARAR